MVKRRRHDINVTFTLSVVCHHFVLISALASVAPALLKTLKMEAAGSFQKLVVPFYHTA
jgi:hypothetical protein